MDGAAVAAPHAGGAVAAPPAAFAASRWRRSAEAGLDHMDRGSTDGDDTVVSIGVVSGSESDHTLSTGEADIEVDGGVVARGAGAGRQPRYVSVVHVLRQPGVIDPVAAAAVKAAAAEDARSLVPPSGERAARRHSRESRCSLVRAHGADPRRHHRRNVASTPSMAATHSRYSLSLAAAKISVTPAPSTMVKQNGETTSSFSCRAGAVSVESAVATPTHTQPDVVIVDPPRTGLSPEVVTGLLTWQAPRIVYVSCDVPTLARDANRLLAGGYRLTSLDALDMFPDTPHVECVAVFNRVA